MVARLDAVAAAGCARARRRAPHRSGRPTVQDAYRQTGRRYSIAAVAKIAPATLKKNKALAEAAVVGTISVINAAKLEEQLASGKGLAITVTGFTRVSGHSEFGVQIVLTDPSSGERRTFDACHRVREFVTLHTTLFSFFRGLTEKDGDSEASPAPPPRVVTAPSGVKFPADLPVHGLMVPSLLHFLWVDTYQRAIELEAYLRLTVDACAGHTCKPLVKFLNLPSAHTF